MKNNIIGIIITIVFYGLLIYVAKSCDTKTGNSYDTEYYQERDQGRGVDAPRRSRSRARRR